MSRSTQSYGSLESTDNNDKSLLPILTNIDNKKILTNIDNKKIQSQSSTYRILAFAAVSTLIAINMIGINIIISRLGPDEEAAGSLISTIQSVVCGSVFGILQATGLEVGAELGKQDASKISRANEIGLVLRTALITGVFINLIASGIFMAMYPILPLIVNKKTGTAAGSFLFASGYSFVPFFETMPGMLGIIIATVEKRMLPALFAAASYRLIGVSLSYVMTYIAGLGIRGSAYGSAIAGILTIAWVFPLLLRKPYKIFKICSKLERNFISSLGRFFKDGSLLAFQRLSEWGNLLLITLCIGASNNTALKALQPGIQTNILIGLCLQGIGQAAMVFISQDHRRKEQHLASFRSNIEEKELSYFSHLITVSQKTMWKNTATGVGVSILLSGAAYLAREPIIDLFLPGNLTHGSNQSNTLYVQAENELGVNMLCMVPDAFRIVTNGVLRGRGDILAPTLMSTIVMTVLGVSGAAAFYFTGLVNSATVFFFVRMGATALCALYNITRFYQHVKKDKKMYRCGQNALLFSNQLKSYQEHNDVVMTNLFDTVSATLGDDGMTAHEIESNTLSNIAFNRESYLEGDDIVNDFSEGLSKKEQSVMLPIIKSLSDILNRPIIISVSNGKRFCFEGSSERGELQPIILDYNEETGLFETQGGINNQITEITEKIQDEKYTSTTCFSFN